MTSLSLDLPDFSTVCSEKSHVIALGSFRIPFEWMNKIPGVIGALSASMHLIQVYANPALEQLEVYALYPGVFALREFPAGITDAEARKMTPAYVFMIENVEGDPANVRFVFEPFVESIS